MDKELLQVLIPALLGSGFLGTLIGVWFNRKRTAAEASKLNAEAQSTQTDRELSTADFHRATARRAQDRLDDIEARYSGLHNDLLAAQRELSEQQAHGFTLQLTNDRLTGDVEVLQDIIARLRSLNIKLRSRVSDGGNTQRLDELQRNIDIRIKRHEQHVDQRAAADRRVAGGTAEDRAHSDG